MRAHFAGDVANSVDSGGSGTGSGISSERGGGGGERDAALAARIDDFKRDSKNLEALTEFIDDVLHKAEAEATKQQQRGGAVNGEGEGNGGGGGGGGGRGSTDSEGLQQGKEKSRQSFAIPDFKNGKVVNRARGLVVRIFDAICNCANTAAAPATRIKLRGKRSNSTANGTTAAADLTEPQEKPEKTATKEKKDEKKRQDADADDEKQQ